MDGQTLLLNLYHPPKILLKIGPTLKLFLKRVVEAAGMTPLEHTFTVEHFPVFRGGVWRGGGGVSASMILIESHIFIHTWPELLYARVELSSCKPINLDSVLMIVKAFCGERCRVSYKLVDWVESEEEMQYFVNARRMNCEH